MANKETDPADLVGWMAEVGSRVMQALVEGGRVGARQARETGERWLKLVQARRDLDTLYNKLGREVVRLVEAGELDHPGLVARTQRIHEQLARIEALKAEAGATGPESPAPAEGGTAEGQAEAGD